MKRIILIILFCITLSGCSTYTLSPEPISPEYYFDVSINSNPSGADVYIIEQDGKIGEKIGTTPFVHKVGLAVQYKINENGTKRPSGENVWLWGMRWGEKYSYGLPAVLDIVVAKEGYKSERTLNTVYTWSKNNFVWPPYKKNISINVSLEQKTIK